ncbi:ATPase [Mastigocoleus testarum BC008]|uniref:histidine kinase n=2 Tax=Mastigocoleus TaxID=996924 RepID=A0A0V7ZKX8_9CYAN|nr:ATPase [Mastigocoleus testarum BC008]
MQLSSQKLKKQLDLFTKGFQEQPAQHKVLASMIEEIREPIDLNATFEAIVAQVRQLLNADRVAVLRFSPEDDWEGQFIFENVSTDWDSIVGEKIRDRCFAEKFATDYSQGRIQAVTDVHVAKLNDCHAEMLEKYQVRANLVIPLIKETKLWGLLCIHQCSSAREWKSSEIKFVITIARLLTVAIQQLDRIEKADLAKKLATAKQKHKMVVEIIEKIRDSLDIDTILSTTTQEIRQLLKVDRVAIFQFNSDWSGNFVAESFERAWTPLIGVSPTINDTYLQDTQGGRYTNNESFAVDDIYQAGFSECHVTLLEQFQAKAFVVIPILKEDKLWGLIGVYQNSSPRNWQADEVEILAQIASQVSVALSHYELFANARYEIEQQKALTSTIASIRQSVALEDIFQTTVTQVRQLLKADRVAIFRFDPGNKWEGEIIYEDVALGLNSALKDKVYDHCFAQNYVPLYRQGRISAISDIYKHDFKKCYIQILEKFQVRANIVAPLIKAGELWGLLCIHQCERTRDWQSSEIEFVYQIGEQLGTALKQDTYWEQVQSDMQAKVAEHKQAMERQKLLAITVDKIRHSLDIQTIFETSTQAVRELLKVDRVSIYRFDSDWRGEFVADSFKDGLQPQSKGHSAILPTFTNTNKDGKLPRHEVFTSISQGKELWGLLIAYQNSYPRHWKSEEIELLNQLGAQLGVAIQQAELLQQTKEQATQLTEAFEEIKQTQEYLIQGEKMANLGELLTGIVSEMNDPVNSILENINEVSQRTGDLLEITSLYHHSYPEASPAIEERLKKLNLDLQNTDLYETLNSMKIGAKHLSQTLGSLEKFSRADESELKLVDINEELNNILLILEHRLKAKGKYPGIEVIEKYDRIPLAECYPAQLNQAFINILLHNISTLEQKFVTIEKEHSGRSSECPYIPLFIWIVTKSVGSKISIKITDNGPGMMESVRENIFDLTSKSKDFQIKDSTTKEVFPRTGLGLGICHQIIADKHQGQIKCFSQVGQGTEFLIEIPTRQSLPIEHFSTFKTF